MSEYTAYQTQQSHAVQHSAIRSKHWSYFRQYASVIRIVLLFQKDDVFDIPANTGLRAVLPLRTLKYFFRSRQSCLIEHNKKHPLGLRADVRFVEMKASHY
ncbi:hypothetical protein AAGG74_19450 [Bacillus mexicanus]